VQNKGTIELEESGLFIEPNFLKIKLEMENKDEGTQHEEQTEIWMSWISF
jgi:hypothetical protein